MQKAHSSEGAHAARPQVWTRARGKSYTSSAPRGCEKQIHQLPRQQGAPLGAVLFRKPDEIRLQTSHIFQRRGKEKPVEWNAALVYLISRRKPAKKWSRGAPRGPSFTKYKELEGIDAEVSDGK